MDLDTVFLIGNRIILVGWLAILVGLFLPKLRPALFAFSGLILPGLLAVAYVALISMAMTGEQPPGGGMGSLAGIKALFSVDAAMTAGWYHYLAFDMVVGTWIARDALEHGVPRLLVVPVLPLTLAFGPAGFLLYLVIRVATAFLKRAPAAQTP